MLTVVPYPGCDLVHTLQWDTKQDKPLVVSVHVCYVSQIQGAILAHTWQWDTKRDKALVMLLYACVLLVPDPGRHPSPHVALGHEVGQSDGSVTVGPSVYVSQIQGAILAHA